MPQPPVDGKLISSSVGRTRAQAAQRLVAPHKKAVSQTALQRATLGNKAHALGTPLSSQVKAQGRLQLKQHSSMLANLSPHFLGTGFALASAGMWLFGLELPLALAAAGLLYGAGYLLGKSVQDRRFASGLASEINLAQEFDAFVDANSTRLPAEALEELAAVKTMLSHILPKLGKIQQEGLFGQEDIFFLQQTVTRYLPDACLPYFSIPADKQDRPLLDRAKTPKQILLEQFQLVRVKLGELEEQLIRAEAQKLAQHKRFLERKASV